MVLHTIKYAFSRMSQKELYDYGCKKIIGLGIEKI